MKAIYELKEMLCDELEEVGKKGELTAGSLDTVDKLAHAIKNIDKIIESYEEEGYSGRGGSYERGGNRGGSYEGGSYARGNGRGRGSNARRDSMGRYSSERGYSRDADDLISRIEGMMHDAPNDQVRQDMRHLVDSLRSA